MAAAGAFFGGVRIVALGGAVTNGGTGIPVGLGTGLRRLGSGRCDK